MDVHSVYSVWNWNKGRYDYYRSNRSRPVRSRVGYPAARGLKGVGEVPEQSVHALPAGAQYVGEGDMAVGTVASPVKRNGAVFVVAALGALWWLS